ncbi:MAG: mersacidin/lichenicidin family type 2 lantibiotic [Gemmatimonadaceae bacterium]|nr:mersacidin/lichenicidin family type 2 lantibiotic [Gloeobacterales cyanobacterium ES-bin-141]
MQSKKSDYIPAKFGKLTGLIQRYAQDAEFRSSDMTPNNDRTERSWKDEDFRKQLSPEEQAALAPSPVEPQGELLDEDELDEIAGGAPSLELGCGNLL